MEEIVEIPNPIEEGAVRVHWRSSLADPRKVVTIFEIDFGKTKLNPISAANVSRAVVALLRTSLGVKLTPFK